MTPTVAGPPSTSQRSAGAEPRSSVSGRERVRGRQPLEDVLGGDHLAAGPGVVGVQRHLLDEAQLVAVLQAEVEQRDGVLLVDPAQQDGVDLDRRQPGGLRGGEPGEDVVEPVAVGELLEAVAVDGVEADVDPVQPGRGQRRGDPGQADRVGGQADLGAGAQRGRARRRCRPARAAAAARRR